VVIWKLDERSWCKYCRWGVFDMTFTGGRVAISTQPRIVRRNLEELSRIAPTQRERKGNRHDNVHEPGTICRKSKQAQLVYARALRGDMEHLLMHDEEADEQESAPLSRLQR